MTIDREEFERIGEQLVAQIAADGYDPAVVVPLYDLIGESAVAGAMAKANNDMGAATICYGRVSGLFDALAVLGIPVPAPTPSDVMKAADEALSNPEALVARITQRVEEGEGPLDTPA